MSVAVCPVSVVPGLYLSLSEVSIVLVSILASSAKFYGIIMAGCDEILVRIVSRDWRACPREVLKCVVRRHFVFQISVR